jgi:ribonuclease-3
MEVFMSEKRNSKMYEKKKPWPSACVWPDPTKGGFWSFWEAEDAESLPLDDFGEELLDIKYYMDDLVSEGRLNADYKLNAHYDDDDESCDAEEWEPEQGLEYWDNGFDYDIWLDDLSDHLNNLKLPLPSPADEIRRIIGYEFINENLLRQAFTRRAFGLEHGTGDSEVLELIGDSVLNIVVTRELVKHLTDIRTMMPSAPFCSTCSEGELSRIRTHYVCREYLASRAAVLGLDRYILYGETEEPGEGASEDMIEALIGAVAADCGWDWHVIEEVVDNLLCLQVEESKELLTTSYYDMFNSWHQKKFGRMPEYDVIRNILPDKVNAGYEYNCALRYQIPDNDKGIWTSQRVDINAETRSKARERAAMLAYDFVVSHGLWMNLADARIKPDLENSINQLQELYQKKYVEEAPEYRFEERKLPGLEDEWCCDCICGGVTGWGIEPSKVKAKKKASLMVLKRLMRSAGLNAEEIEEDIQDNIHSDS